MRRLGVRVPHGAPNTTDTLYGCLWYFLNFFGGTRTRKGVAVKRASPVDWRVSHGSSEPCRARAERQTCVSKAVKSLMAHQILQTPIKGVCIVFLNLCSNYISVSSPVFCSEFSVSPQSVMHSSQHTSAPAHSSQHTSASAHSSQPQSSPY